MNAAEEVLFTTQLRKSTRHVHSISDALVQSKFVFGLIDDKVWAEGLLVFYEIFRCLEDAMERLPTANIAKYKGRDGALMRTKCFESDLERYYGANWRAEHPTRECVRKYTSHLHQLEKTDSDMLIAYVYHLYLGLLSGGRILRKKQKLLAQSCFSEQSLVVDFDPESTVQLKRFIKDTTNGIADTLSAEAKNRVLEEGVRVFKLNCELIRSVNSANDVLHRTVLYALYVMVVAVAIGVGVYAFGATTDEQERIDKE